MADVNQPEASPPGPTPPDSTPLNATPPARRRIENVDPSALAERLAEVRAEIGDGVEILIATKYLDVEGMGALAEAGVNLVGENRLQELQDKQERWGDTFTWDFIGAVQSRKVRDLLPPGVRLIHAIASDSSLTQLEKHADPQTEVLVEVNIAGEAEKGGVAPLELAEFIERCPVKVGGLMTMPPFAEDPEASRPHFVRLAELAAKHDLKRLSMGTSQDWKVAAEEGATIIRLGGALLQP